MVVKTITIKESAYEVLKTWKRPGDSFSDAIERMGKKKVTAKDIFGIGKDLNMNTEQFKKEIKNNKEKFNKSWEERKNALTRQLSSN